MSATYVGNLSLGGSIPGAAAAGVAGAAGINGALPDVEARIAALQAFTPSLYIPSVALAQAFSIAASIQGAITAGIPVPDLAAQIAEVAALISSLLAQVTAINAQLTIVNNFLGLMGEAGVHVYVLQGAVNSIGADLNAALAVGFPAGGSPSDFANAVVLVTTVGATWTAMQQVFAT